MKDASQATHRALAADYDRRALRAHTSAASRAYRRLAAHERTLALLAGRDRR